MKRWPTKDDLYAWLLFQKLDEIPHFDSPEQVKQVLQEIDAKMKDTIQVEKDLWDDYQDYREEFNHPVTL